MRSLTEGEIGRWCETRGLRITADGYLRYEPESWHCFDVGLEGKASAVVGLAGFLTPSWEDAPSGGALFWVVERGIWGDLSETMGATLMEKMRRADGEMGPLERSPGHLFGPSEEPEAEAYVLLPLLFWWDAFLVAESGDYFVFISHDGEAVVVGRTAEKAEEVRQRVEGWSPKDDQGWYRRMAERDGE